MLHETKSWKREGRLGLAALAWLVGAPTVIVVICLFVRGC